MITDKQEFAQFITNLFSKKETIELIVKEAIKHDNTPRYVSLCIGDIFTFYVATRSQNCSPALLSQIIKHVGELESYDQLSKVIGKEIYNTFKKQGRILSPEEIVKQVGKNYVENGFYMHSFTSANLDNIYKTGLDPRVRLFKEERSNLNLIIDYSFEPTANKLFATGNYSIVYSYGSRSPEWVYSLFNDSDIMRKKDYTKAYDMVTKSICEKIKDPIRIEKLNKDAENILKFYLKENLSISVAVLDRRIKNEHGNYIFINEDNDEISEYSATINHLQFDYTNAKTLSNQISNDISAITTKFSPYEVSAITKINCEDFSLITLPGYPKFQKEIDKQTTKPEPNISPLTLF